MCLGKVANAGVMDLPPASGAEELSPLPMASSPVLGYGASAIVPPTLPVALLPGLEVRDSDTPFFYNLKVFNIVQFSDSLII